MTGTLLTTLDVAELLGLSSAAVTQAVRSGALEPAARTNDDFLFSERAVAAFAQLQAEVAVSPLEPPAASSRSEWSGDVDRLNLWLKDLNEVLRVPGPDAASAVSKAPASSAEVPAPAPAAPSILERIAARQPAATAELVETPAVAGPVAASPAVESVAGAERAPETLLQHAAPPPAAASPAPVPAPPQSPVAVPAQEDDQRLSRPGPDLSRQAVLVVQPIVRFRVLREVSERLAGIPGIADARLERLEGGVASYRVSFEGERPSGDAIGEGLAHLNLEVILVDSFL